jgi:hypothetical protein
MQQRLIFIGVSNAIYLKVSTQLNDRAACDDAGDS